MYDQVAQNKRRSFLLVAGFVVLLTAVMLALNLLLGGGWAFGVVALLIAGASAAVSYWKSDAIALRVSRAHPASVEEYARLHNLVEGLCIAGGLPKPRIYVIDDAAPNAFATGRNPKHAAIAVTTGLLEKHEPGRARGRAGPRAQPHQELRHPRVDPRRHHGRHHRHRGRHRRPLHVVRDGPQPQQRR